MSLFGKILAVLNILGAIAFFCLVNLDYGKRRAWAYQVFRHELMLDGLPLDKDENTLEARPRHELLGEATQKELFDPVGGQPVTTQQAEVERVREEFASPLRSAGKNQQFYGYARVLLPLAETNLEREELLAYRTHFASDKAAAALKTRYQQAFQQARPPAAADDPLKTFHARFRRAVNEQGGEPSEALTAALLRTLPEKPEELAKENFDAKYDSTLDAQRADLQTRFTRAFDEPIRANREREARRAAIARLLFDLAPLRAEEAVDAPQGDPNDKKIVGTLAHDTAPFAGKLLDTRAYQTALKRAQTVVGVRATAVAMGRQAQVLRQVAGELASAVVRDRAAFMAEHQHLLDAIQTRALEVEAEAALLARKQAEVKTQNALVESRRKDVKWYEAAVAESRAETAQRWKELKGMSQELYNLRVQVRDALAENEKSEKQIRQSEERIRELEGEK